MTSIVCLALLMVACVGVEGVLRMSLEEVLKIGDYDGALRPNLRGGATRVNVSINVYALSLDLSRQVIDLSGELIQEWTEPNLELSASSSGILDTIGLPGTSGGSVQERVWKPDLTSHADVDPVMSPPHHQFLRISRNGHLIWTQRVRYSFPCKLDLSVYPMGSHACTLKLHSLGYGVEELAPEWKGDTPVDADGVVMSHGFSLSSIKSSSKNVVMVQRALRELRVELKLRSNSGWTVKHTIVPLVATVTCAYLAFWMHSKAVAARMVTCMLSFVTAAIFHESTYRDLPATPQTMALEVFTGTCLTFIFVAAVETVAVDVLANVSNTRRASTHNSFALDPDLTDERVPVKGSLASIWLDRCARVLYPAAFLAFNAVYWVLYN